MPKDNLLKEAIADAKAVRDTAIANARLHLEEAFTPQLRSMLSARLRNEIEGIDGQSVNEDNDASSEIGTGLTVDNPAPKKPSKATSDSSHIENDGIEFTDMGEGDSHKAPIKEAGEIPGAGIPGEEEPDLDPALGADPQAGLGVGAGAGMDGIADTPDELDLDAIIRELELDVQNDDMALAQGGAAPQHPAVPAAPAAAIPAAPAAPAPAAPEDEPKLESFQDAQAGKYVDGAMDGALKETVSGKSGDGTFHDGKSPKAVDGVNGGKKVSAGQAVTGSKADTMTEELDLDEILREIEAEDASVQTETSNIASENVELKKSLREHRDVIVFLRDKLQEVNMLNAKLLYTNKLFKGFDLKVEQKMRVVETFDRASTVREVKLIYTTLAESLTGKISGSKKSTAKAITEGLASKATGSTAPKNTTILAEGNTQVERWQKIAGIKK